MISVDVEQAVASGHVLAAFSGLGAGAAVLLLPKGTHTHRVIGVVYVLALVLVNVAALSLHREDTLVNSPRWQSSASSRSRSGSSPPPRQEIAGGHHHSRVLHDVVVRRSGRSWVRTTRRRCRSGRRGVGRPGGDRNGVSISGIVIFGRVPSILDRLLPNGDPGDPYSKSSAR